MKKTNVERFNEKYVVKENGCWVWTAGLNKDSYGKFWSGLYSKNGSPISELAHRWAFMEFKGPLQKGNYVLHSCDVPPCVNPDHLFQGTQRINVKDCVEKNRHPQTRKILSEEEIFEIRTFYTGKYGEIRNLAKKHGVNPNTISRVLSNSAKNYGKHVQSLRWQQRQRAIRNKSPS